ncbi:MAG TPA: MBL fold metallo-hydrolase [Rhodopila sp.]|uniref:MBL fold metallo-hydrolase n=1 Tax=Rhodopila sp. TaxID=2480087 RepID=UPI002C6BB917|nr:MBL fold metallo-hydrolase [Rhodopila sp.]HVY17330.1 MBL fold metallo-hydrolase [Rhodopila sp.]
MAEERPLLRGALVPVTPFQQNCSIFWDDATKEGMVVDPGGDVPRIVAAIGKTGARVTKIVLTHGHLDHAGGAAALRDALGGVPIEGPDPRDAFLLEKIAEQAAGYGFEAQNVTPDRWLAEGETLAMGPHRFEILHCPGHTPGSLVFVHHPAKFLIAGDVLFQGSVGRTDFPYGDADALITAIKTKLLVLPDDYAFICGHGPGSTIGVEKATNPFLQ